MATAKVSSREPIDAAESLEILTIDAGASSEASSSLHYGRTSTQSLAELSLVLEESLAFNKVVVNSSRLYMGGHVESVWTCFYDLEDEYAEHHDIHGVMMRTRIFSEGSAAARRPATIHAVVPPAKD